MGNMKREEGDWMEKFFNWKETATGKNPQLDNHIHPNCIFTSKASFKMVLKMGVGLLGGVKFRSFEAAPYLVMMGDGHGIRHFSFFISQP
jgi:hypothetical protein